MHLLATTAKDIIGEHKLPILAVKPKDAKWWRTISGVSLGVAKRVDKDYNAFISDHRAQLDKDYSIERSWWIASFHYHQADRLSLPRKDADWWSLYRTMLGNPYPDLPRELDWRVVINRQWLQQKTEARRKFEEQFLEEHPDADRVEACETNSLLWQTWNEWTYIHGFDTLFGTWWKLAKANLDQRKGLIGVLY